MVQIHLEEMVRIRAGESLQAATIFALGAGRIAKSETRSILRDWSRKAKDPFEEKKKLTTKEAEARLAFMGIKVVKK